MLKYIQLFLFPLSANQTLLTSSKYLLGNNCHTDEFSRAILQCFWYFTKWHCQDGFTGFECYGENLRSSWAGRTQGNSNSEQMRLHRRHFTDMLYKKYKGFVLKSPFEFHSSLAINKPPWTHLSMWLNFRQNRQGDLWISKSGTYKNELQPLLRSE